MGAVRHAHHATSRSCPRPRALLLLALPFSILVGPHGVGASPWHKVKPEELALQHGRVNAEADAEALEWEIVVSDDFSGEILRSSETQYLRVKIFTPRGRESFAQIDIPYSNGVRVTDVAARTIRPDGSVIELNGKALFDRTIVKGGGLKLKVKSMAIPGVVPGCIVEYRWTTVQYDRLANYVRVELQRDIPVELLRFSIHPLLLKDSPYRMRIRAFNFHMPPFSEDANGLHTMVLSDMPAAKEEPFMPPPARVRPWIAIYYAEEDEPPPDAFWKQFGARWYERSRSLYGGSGEVKKAAASAVGSARDQAEIVDRILQYCRTWIRNADLSDSGLTNSDREWLRSEHSASDYIKRGMADRDGILKVFLSMASSWGLDARMGLLPDRSECIFDSRIPAFYLLTRTCAAVRVQGAWRAVDPAADLPPGMLPWWEEGVEMLVPDPEATFFVRTPVSPPDWSASKRVARLKLSEDGTMEGDVHEEFGGHLGALRRGENRDRSVVDQEKTWTDRLHARMSTAELSGIQFDRGSDASQPFRLRYHIRVPGYAQRAGSRLLLQPEFLHRGLAQTFPAGTRDYPVFFQHPWMERDTIQIELPPHFRVEKLSEPEPVVLPDLGMHSVKVTVSDDGRQLQVVHAELFGTNGTIAFPVEQYPALKDAFERFQRQDDAVLSLIADEETVH